MQLFANSFFRSVVLPVFQTFFLSSPGNRCNHPVLHSADICDRRRVCIRLVLLGDRMDVYLETARRDRFIANVDPHISVNIDDVIKFYIDIEKIHFFELGNTGKNVTIKD